MKNLIIAIALCFVGVSSFGAQYCVNIEDPKFAYISNEFLPDGSVWFSRVTYSYNDVTYHISASKNSTLSAVCKAFGKKQFLKYEGYFDPYKKELAVILDRNGNYLDREVTENLAVAILCK